MRTNLTKRWAAGVLAVGMVTVASLFAPASPATAASGLEYHFALSATNSQPVKTVAAQCPQGMMAIDGGADVQFAQAHQVRLTGLRPVGRDFEVTATARPSGFDGDWRLVAYAFCVSERRDITVEVVTSTLSTQFWRTHRVECPAGRNVIGLGAHLSDADERPPAGVALHLLLPSADLTRTDVGAYQVDGDGSELWRLRSYATCAPPLPGLERAVSPVGAVGIATATCSPGKVVYGIGGGHNAAPTWLALTRMEPALRLMNSATVVGGVAAGQPPSTWHTIAFAICAN